MKSSSLPVPGKQKKKKHFRIKDQMEIDFNPGLFSEGAFMIKITSSEGLSIKITKE